MSTRNTHLFCAQVKEFTCLIQFLLLLTFKIQRIFVIPNARNSTIVPRSTHVVLCLTNTKFYRSRGDEHITNCDVYWDFENLFGADRLQYSFIVLSPQ